MARATRSLLRAAALAAITGGRTMLAPALVARRRARSGWLRAGVYLAAAAELIGDKLPRTPKRTMPIGLAFRAVSGACVVRALLRPRGRAAAVGALALGAAAAIASAFGGVRLRLALTRRLGGGARANALAGVIEDVALLATGRRLAGP